MIDKYLYEKWATLENDNLHPSEKIQVSNFGRLRSFKVSATKPKIIKGSWLAGYNIIVLRNIENKANTFYVHKLVAKYFVLDRKDDQTFVGHLDYDKKNNHFQNLKWMSRAELNAHRHKDKNYDKSKIRNSKLTETDVIRIKKMLSRGNIKPYRIALQFGISQTQLSRIKNGQNWNHIKVG